MVCFALTTASQDAEIPRFEAKSYTFAARQSDEETEKQNSNPPRRRQGAGVFMG